MLEYGNEGGEIRKRSRHMPSIVAGSSLTCFFKDGRKIGVGDCALFKPAQDSLTVVGIIRSLTSDKKSNLTLGVKWLYRPAEVKLLKSVSLEVEPNEVFYSFHWDEIPAASLLHPCKVAFLSKGAELPAGIASFVCRRVYDITNKCLWWLSDRDFIDERQDEVDRLLHKTHIEMYTSVGQQQGPRSPKPPNGSGATSPQKQSTGCLQTSTSNLVSKMKGKKRDREDQSFEPIKRERNAIVDDGDTGQVKFESFLNLEIAKVAERGGLSDSETVTKLVRLMQPERSQRKLDLAGRSMLAGIIAATNKPDYLSQFIQLKGLVVLDEWLQEVHKGKIVDSGNVKDSDKAVENFILVLLCALFKLPVNLNALQMCNIGKSVNYLRSHKNSEIQKKARSLVDTWKKRVEAEMTINDAKSGSTQAVPSPGRSRDGSHGIGGYKHSSGSFEVATKGLVTHHSSLNSSSVKLAQGESNLKYGSTHQSNTKSALSNVTAINSKGVEPKNCDYHVSSETPQTVAKEQKSSGSNQSHTNSQSSSEHVKSLVPCKKEDVKRFIAGPKSLNKPSGSDTKHKKSAIGRSVGVQKETASNRSPLAEKISHNTDGLIPVGSTHGGNNHKLIVKIPNRVRGPQSIVACADDTSCKNSSTSSPACPEMHDKSDVCSRVRYGPHNFDEGGDSSAVQLQRTNDMSEVSDVSTVACSPGRNEMKLKTHESSLSSLNALIDCCVELLEANVPMSAGDDLGINLLASVAVDGFAGISSPALSPHISSTTAEHSSINHDGFEKQLHSDGVIQQEGVSAGVGCADNCNTTSIVVNITDKEPTEHLGITHEDLHQKVEGYFWDNGISDEQITAPCSTVRSLSDLSPEVRNEKENVVNGECRNQLPGSCESVVSHVKVEDKVKDKSLYDKPENTAHMDTTYTSTDDTVKAKEPKSNIPPEQKLRPVSLKSESMFSDEMRVISSKTRRRLVAENATINGKKPASVKLFDHTDEEGKKRLVRENGPLQILEKQEVHRVDCADVTMVTRCKAVNLDTKDAFVQQSSTSSQLCSSAVVMPEDLRSGVKQGEFREGRSKDSDAMTVDAASLPATGCSDPVAKHDFDLNEGVNVDEGELADSLGVAACPWLATVYPASSLQFPVISAPSGPLTSVTVVAASKETFAQPDDLLRSKMKVLSKESASTTAFCPAEPRPNGLPRLDGAVCKQARPPLDIDLNVAAESYGQESDFKHNSFCELTTTASLRGSGGLDLDLNKIEAPDMVQQSSSDSHRIQVLIPPVKALSSSTFTNEKASSMRDFDLNDGPAVEEMPSEHTLCSQPVCNNLPLQSSFGPGLYNSGARNLIAWNPTGMSYSVSLSPYALPDKEAFPADGIGRGLHSVMGGPTSSLSFYPDTYRESVFASSPAMPFQSAPFQYPVYPFGTSFPLTTSALTGGSSGYMDPAVSGRISAIPSQLGGNAPAVSFQYPYAVQCPISYVSSNGIFDSNKNWGNQGVNLNSGPGDIDLDRINGSIPTVSRQISATSSQPLVEEQAMMYRMGGGILKRKESDRVSSMDKLNFTQSSWRG